MRASWTALLLSLSTLAVEPPSASAQLQGTAPSANQPQPGAKKPSLALAPVSPIFKRDLNAGGKLRGFVDLHTHPMAHLGFGGKLLHGAPGVGVAMPPGAIFDPRGVGLSGATCNAAQRPAASISEALGSCYSSHAGHDLISNKCGNDVRRLVLNGFEDGKRTNKPHDVGHPEGYPNFTRWPKYDDILHQQMWVDWIKRAYEGGMRVMVALAVNSYTFATGLEANEPRGDKASGDLQLRELQRFVGRHSWMAIARSPADLRKIVGRDDKLAVVLGVELDDIGDFVKNRTPPTAEAVRAELRRLHGQGVRYIFPLHVIDNYFGGTAVYEDEFNRANCFHYGQWWELGCATPGAMITHTAASGWDVLKTIKLGQCGGAWPVPSCGEKIGHVNKRRLTTLGKEALSEMMRLGMIIDIDHADQSTVSDMLDYTHSSGYPLVSGHNGLRSSAGNENERTEAEYREIAARGGIAGVGWGDSDTERWLKSVREVKATGVSIALGSDINGLVKMPAPRAKCADGSCVKYSASFPQAALGSKRWDYNTEGVAHIGLFPDALRDVEGLGGQSTVEQLFNGAEAFAAMWEKALRAGATSKPPPPGMAITSALYGRNCNIPQATADITRWVKSQCDGNPGGCTYSFSWLPWGGDPSPSLCKKQIAVHWRCANGATKETLVLHEQTPQAVHLACP